MTTLKTYKTRSNFYNLGFRGIYYAKYYGGGMTASKKEKMRGEK